MSKIREVLSQYESREVRNAYAFLLPIIAVLVLFILIPVIGTLIGSFYYTPDNFEKAGGFVGFENFVNVIKNPTPNFGDALLFTLGYSFFSVLLETVLGIIFALVLNEPLKGRGILRAIILIPWAVPTIVSAGTWQLIYDGSYGLLNYFIRMFGGNAVNWLSSQWSSFWAVVIADVWKTTPFIVIILLAGLQAIPQDIYKQARVDGAGMWKQFWRITLPLIWPVLAIALIFRTIDAMRMFDLVFVLTQNRSMTLSSIGYTYFNAYDGFGMGSAVSVITFLLSFAVTIVYIKLAKFGETLK